MPAVLTHKTIMLMARERLGAIRDALRAKNDRGPMSDLEHRVWYLADKAWTYMTDDSLRSRHVTFPQDGVSYVTPFAEGTSQWAVMGSMGPDITAFSAMFARGQGWVFDTLHKGSPDANREPVVAKTTDFALTFWSQVASHEAARRIDATRADWMRGYVLGHLCHVAGDVVSHPFIHDLEWHLGNRTRHKFSHAGGEASIDAKVAQQLLLRRSTREGQAWDLWWPTPDEVPDVFFAAYTEAMDQMYQSRSPTNRLKGFGEFEARFTERGSPAFSLDFVKDGYHLYRNGIVSIGYGYGYGSFFGALVPLVLPLSFAIGLSGALPHSRAFFTTRWQDVDERGWFELLTLPLAVTSIIPVFYGIWAATLSTRGAEGLTGAGLAFAFVNLILSIVFFSTVGVDDLPWWGRWLLMFAPMMAIPLVFSCVALGTFLKDDGKKRGGLTLLYGFPFILWIAFILIFLIIVMGLGSIAQALADAISPGAGTGWGVAFYVVGMLGLTAGLIVLWVMLPKFLRDVKIPEFPKAFPAERPHYVRLFDDSTLAFLPSIANVTPKDLYYPSERRPLLKLWFTGAGDLWVRSEQRQIAFSTTGTGAPFLVVPSPVVPMTLKEYGQFLERTVPDLHAAPVYPADEPREYHLPTGATFSEEADEDDETKGIPESVVKFKKLKKTEADANYILRHADKPYQAVRFGSRGTVEVGNPQDEYTALPGTVSSASTTVTGTDTLFGYFFDPGDQIASGTQVRTVTLIHSDTSLEISSPFSPALSGAKFVRLGPGDSMAPAPGKVTSRGTTVTGTQGTMFGASFGPGDYLVVGDQIREVTQVVSNTHLEIAEKFDSRISTESDYLRLVTGRERSDGYPYVSTPASAKAVGGGSVMDFAADLSVLLCLGMTGHLIPEGQRAIPSLRNKRPAAGGDPVSDQVGKVYQVFRNWSLDRRRLNEWKMLVAGGARSEKSAPEAYDTALLQPQPGDWHAPDAVVRAGEPVANAQGWVPVLRQWMARVAAGDVTDPNPPAGGGPASMTLSQAMAFILDLQAPVRLAP